MTEFEHLLLRASEDIASKNNLVQKLQVHSLFNKNWVRELG
jgi:hypothetical protein